MRWGWRVGEMGMEGGGWVRCGDGDGGCVRWGWRVGGDGGCVRWGWRVGMEGG